MSRYASDAVPDYSHRFHAGNVGDVWKHCALIEVLRRASAGAVRLHYVESHAGDGLYPLAPTGEWSEGIGRLWPATDLGDGVVARYVELCRRLGSGTARPDSYPGSPLLARAVLGPDAQLSLWERDPEAIARLATHLGRDPNTRLSEGDGLAALANPDTEGESREAGGQRASPSVVLVDPPWTHKADWTAVPDAVARAARAFPAACLLLWYPVKSLTRPNAMHARLEAACVSATIAELITTSLKHQRNRLNGSGMLLVRPPAGTLEALAAAAPVLARLCATRADAWSFRMQAW